VRCASGQSVDAVIEIGDLSELTTPFYVYQDLSFDVLERYYDDVSGVPGFKGIDLDTIRRRKERQHRIYDSAAGIFAVRRGHARTERHRLQQGGVRAPDRVAGDVAETPLR